MPSGMYRPLAVGEMNSTSLLSCGSIWLPGRPKSLAPRPITAVNALLARSSTATAFASCNVTNARVPPLAIAMYSGSKSIPVFVRRWLP